MKNVGSTRNKNRPNPTEPPIVKNTLNTLVFINYSPTNLLYTNKATKPVTIPPTTAIPGLTLNNSIYNHLSSKVITTKCKIHKTKSDNKKISINYHHFTNILNSITPCLNAITTNKIPYVAANIQAVLTNTTQPLPSIANALKNEFGLIGCDAGTVNFIIALNI